MTALREIFEQKSFPLSVHLMATEMMRWIFWCLLLRFKEFFKEHVKMSGYHGETVCDFSKVFGPQK